MFKKLCILSVLFLSFAFADNIEEKFSSANRFYQQKQYQKSIELYEELVNNGYEGVSLYYNLANAYYRSGQIGFAILNYEKALKLSPGDEDIIHNLTLANSKTVDKVAEFPSFFLFHLWEDMLGLFSLTGWFYFTYILFIVVLSAIAGYFLFRNIVFQKYSFFAGIMAVALFILSISLTLVRFNRDVNTRTGIIIENTANVKSSPEENSTDTFVIHEGLKVYLEEELGSWVRVKLEDGKTGWIEEKNLRII